MTAPYHALNLNISYVCIGSSCTALYTAPTIPNTVLAHDSTEIEGGAERGEPPVHLEFQKAFLLQLKNVTVSSSWLGAIF
jgi:hypothetical protein